MTELARFRPAAARHQHPIVFERASLALLADWHHRLSSPGLTDKDLSLDGEWRDPLSLRLDASPR